MNENGNDNNHTTPSDNPPPCVNKKRRRFSLQEKMCLVRSIRRRIETADVSLRNACDAANIHQKQYLTWKKQFNAMKDARNMKAKSQCIGQTSILKPIKKDLLCFIFQLREQGMGISTMMVMLKAASLSREFRENPEIRNTIW